MYRNLIICYCLLLYNFCLSKNNVEPLTVIRKSFHKAVLDESLIPSFISMSEALPQDIPVFQAYNAVAHALMAQVKWNPIDKLSFVIKFQTLINEAVQKDPQNVEIRFLRFCIEYNIPKWLSLDQHLTEDKNYFIDNIEQINELDFDPFFTRYIIYFIKETGLCSEDDTRIIQNKLALN